MCMFLYATMRCTCLNKNILCLSLLNFSIDLSPSLPLSSPSTPSHSPPTPPLYCSLYPPSLPSISPPISPHLCLSTLTLSPSHSPPTHPLYCSLYAPSLPSLSSFISPHLCLSPLPLSPQFLQRSLPISVRSGLNVWLVMWRSWVWARHFTLIA